MSVGASSCHVTARYRDLSQGEEQRRVGTEAARVTTTPLSAAFPGIFVWVERVIDNRGGAVPERRSQGETVLHGHRMNHLYLLCGITAAAQGVSAWGSMDGGMCFGGCALLYESGGATWTGGWWGATRWVFSPIFGGTVLVWVVL